MLLLTFVGQKRENESENVIQCVASFAQFESKMFARVVRGFVAPYLWSYMPHVVVTQYVNPDRYVSLNISCDVTTFNGHPS